MLAFTITIIIFDIIMNTKSPRCSSSGDCTYNMRLQLPWPRWIARASRGHPLTLWWSPQPAYALAHLGMWLFNFPHRTCLKAHVDNSPGPIYEQHRRPIKGNF